MKAHTYTSALENAIVRMWARAPVARYAFAECKRRTSSEHKRTRHKRPRHNADVVGAF